MVICLCLSGCSAHRTTADSSRQIKVFGAELYSAVDYKEIHGVKAEEEPCLSGYERVFEPLDIMIGYDFDRRIRKITTMHRETSVLGIRPGMTAQQGEELALQSGMIRISPTRYRGNDMSLLLLIDPDGKLFGITVESDR
jgi:hypothetical protein